MVGIIIQMLRYHFEWRKKREFVELAQPCKTLEVVLTKGSGIAKLVGGSPGGGQPSGFSPGFLHGLQIGRGTDRIVLCIS